jgi:predicted DNA-binding transcriptional regulator YafY
MTTPKLLTHLQQLARVDRLIRDPTFAATHHAIALKLKVSTRTARRLVDELRSLGAPLASPGDGWGGWQYEGEWSLAEVVMGAIVGAPSCPVN